MENNRVASGLILFLLALGMLGYFASAANTIKVEANIMSQDSYLMIDVDNDSIHFGNLSRGQVSSAHKICVNNTGTEDAVVTPELSDDYDGLIFDYIYVKRYGDSDSTYKPIGQFNATINHESSRCLWFRLDLSDYTEPIYADIIGHNTNITINAVPLS